MAMTRVTDGGSLMVIDLGFRFDSCITDSFRSRGEEEGGNDRGEDVVMIRSNLHIVFSQHDFQSSEHAQMLAMLPQQKKWSHGRYLSTRASPSWWSGCWKE